MATLAKNTVLKLGSTAITGITSIAWSGRVFAEEDTTNHDAATPVKTTQTTVYDNGKLSLVITWDPDNTEHQGLKTLSASGASQSFNLVQVASASDDTFDGFVTMFAFDTPVTGLLKAKVDIKINGAFS